MTACRGSDVVGRYGGEEFLLVLPETDVYRAATTGDKIRRVLNERPIVSGGVQISITASVGVAEWTVGTTKTSLFAAADGGLLQQRQTARCRNRTERFELTASA